MIIIKNYIFFNTVCYTFILHYFVILGAVRHCKSTTDSTEAEVINFIKAWLVRCTDRIRNANKNSVAENEETVNETDEQV